ncbi:MAG: metal-dependent transcriptional regulator [Anaerolineales bacterium]|nr:metal-dependent transcriptional regulator [Anaerolineales bacterium]
MIDPLFALLIGIGVIAVSVLVFWPKSGLFWRLQERRELTEKVLIEDTLKYIFKCERNQKPATLESLAGILSTSLGRTSEILAITQARGMLEMSGNRFILTQAGRNTAIQVVRAHRLWERYLADSTGFQEADWHQQAERLEHKLSIEETERLSARLGNPTHDPHGDPIPTAKGELVPHGGVPLSDLPLQTLARIVHIEDEPELLYAQIVAEDLHLNMIVEVDETTADRIRFWSKDQEHILAPIVAANISVVPLVEENHDQDLPGVPLDTLLVGEKGRVTAISSLSRGVERRRLFDLGIIPGTVVGVEMVNPGGDPTAYRIRGSVIALRSSQARLIKVDPISEKGPEI